MTREEFYKEYPEFNHIGSPTSIFEKIIVNDFQSQTCENCKSYDGSHKCNNENSIAHETSNRVYPSDGCREDFERKQNEV